MREADLERIQKHVFRTYLHMKGDHMYVTQTEIRAVIQTAIDLDIVRLNEEAPKVLPYSKEKVI